MEFRVETSNIHPFQRSMSLSLHLGLVSSHATVPWTLELWRCNHWIRGTGVMQRWAIDQLLFSCRFPLNSASDCILKHNFLVTQYGTAIELIAFGKSRFHSWVISFVLICPWSAGRFAMDSGKYQRKPDRFNFYCPIHDAAYLGQKDAVPWRNCRRSS